MLTVSPAGSPALSTKVTVETSTSVPPMLLAFVKLSEGVQILCAINVTVIKAIEYQVGIPTTTIQIVYFAF